MKVLGICGFGYTGSGAFLDLFQEFAGVDVCADPEFSIAYTPDGLEDLEYHLMKAPSRYMSSDVALWRFLKWVEGRNNRGSGLRHATGNQFRHLSLAYVHAITQLTWKGYWGWDFSSSGFWRKNLVFRILNSRIHPFLSKVLCMNVDLPPIRDMRMSICPEHFYEESRKYVSSLIRAMGLGHNETVVLNQPFAADHPTKSFPFFENPTALIVDRDPRDIYVLMKRVALEMGRFVPTAHVKDFVEYYRILHVNQEDTTKRRDVIHCRFEDLVYEYDSTLAFIRERIPLGAHVRPGSCFRPEVSINNTQLFLRYPQFADDCAVIARELPEWLYPFHEHAHKPNGRFQAF